MRRVGVGGDDECPLFSFSHVVETFSLSSFNLANNCPGCGDGSTSVTSTNDDCHSQFAIKTMKKRRKKCAIFGDAIELLKWSVATASAVSDDVWCTALMMRHDQSLRIGGKREPFQHSTQLEFIEELISRSNHLFCLITSGGSCVAASQKKKSKQRENWRA